MAYHRADWMEDERRVRSSNLIITITRGKSRDGIITRLEISSALAASAWTATLRCQGQHTMKSASSEYDLVMHLAKAMHYMPKIIILYPYMT
jgi:hypothetical protein